MNSLVPVCVWGVVERRGANADEEPMLPLNLFTIGFSLLYLTVLSPSFMFSPHQSICEKKNQKKKKKNREPSSLRGEGGEEEWLACLLAGLLACAAFGIFTTSYDKVCMDASFREKAQVGASAHPN